MTKTKTNTRTKELIINDIIQLFTANTKLFNDCIEELDDYSGYLDEDRYYDMEYINDFYSGSDPLELLRRVYNGYSEGEVIIDEYGEEHLREFNPLQEYFKGNVYGNLISADHKDYSAYLDDYAIEAMSENRYYIDSIDNNEELTTLFDELEAAEE